MSNEKLPISVDETIAILRRTRVRLLLDGHPVQWPNGSNELRGDDYFLLGDGLPVWNTAAPVKVRAFVRLYVLPMPTPDAARARKATITIEVEVLPIEEAPLVPRTEP